MYIFYTRNKMIQVYVSLSNIQDPLKELLIFVKKALYFFCHDKIFKNAFKFI